MNSILDYVMSPLDKSNCNYFYLLSLFGFITFLFATFKFIFKKNKKKFNVVVITYLIITPLVMYYVNRLLYSMCVKSL